MFVCLVIIDYSRSCYGITEVRKRVYELKDEVRDVEMQDACSYMLQ